jgi:predicted lipoprotein with Yx(FWY)xxD motif
MGTRVVLRVLPLALLAAIGAGVAVAATATHTGTVDTAATKYGAVLASSNGRTLYHLTAEQRGKIACTGTCAKAWPPLTIKKGSKPTAGTGIKQAKLGTIKRPDGSMQVTYNGYALYRYGDDTKKGDAKGEGEGGIWFAVSPAGALVKSSGGATTSRDSTTTSPTTTDDNTTTSRGYGY